jgi:hypothetical protein
MKNRFLVVITILALVQFACTIPLPFNIKPSNIGLEEGSGHVISQDFNVSGFHKVTLNGTGELEITFGSKEALRVEAEDNVIDKISAEVEDGTLTLSYKEPFRVVPTEPIKFYLTAKQLDGLFLNGAGEIRIEDIQGTDLDVTINGAGTVTASGEVDSQTVVFNGAGSYQADDLQSSEAQVTINGLGNGTLWVTDKLDATIDGAGKLQYYGSPMVSQHINGAGSVESKGEHK